MTKYKINTDKYGAEQITVDEEALERVVLECVESLHAGKPIFPFYREVEVEVKTETLRILAYRKENNTTSFIDVSFTGDEMAHLVCLWSIQVVPTDGTYLAKKDFQEAVIEKFGNKTKELFSMHSREYFEKQGKNTGAYD